MIRNNGPAIWRHISVKNTHSWKAVDRYCGKTPPLRNSATQTALLHALAADEFLRIYRILAAIHDLRSFKPVSDLGIVSGRTAGKQTCSY